MSGDVARRLSEHLFNRYPSGSVPLAEARQLYLALIRLVVTAVKESDMAPDRQSELLSSLAETFAQLPKPWHD